MLSDHIQYFGIGVRFYPAFFHLPESERDHHQCEHKETTNNVKRIVISMLLVFFTSQVRPQCKERTADHNKDNDKLKGMCDGAALGWVQMGTGFKWRGRGWEK